MTDKLNTQRKESYMQNIIVVNVVVCKKLCPSLCKVYEQSFSSS